MNERKITPFNQTSIFISGTLEDTSGTDLIYDKRLKDNITGKGENKRK